MIVRDLNGKILVVLCESTIFGVDSILVEARAVWSASVLCCEMGFD